MSSIVDTRDLRAYYGLVEALHGVDMTVRPGELVAVLGPNGAGKTTLMRAISRAVRTTGHIEVLGEKVTKKATEAVAALGVAHVPEGRGTFVDLTVAENLKLGLLARGSRMRAERDADLEQILEQFPVLREMSGRQAGSLSGGQQQILAIARALLGRPRLLLIDELSLGLAPLITAEIFEKLEELRQQWDLSILLAEQNVHQSLSLAARGYVLDSGAVVATGTPDELRNSGAIERAYVGS